MHGIIMSSAISARYIDGPTRLGSIAHQRVEEKGVE
jgi:hypothetical protein